MTHEIKYPEPKQNEQLYSPLAIALVWIGSMVMFGLWLIGVSTTIQWIIGWAAK